MANQLKYAFRLTHIDNIQHVLSNGLVRASSPLRSDNYLPIGDSKVIKIRGNRVVGGYRLSEYVPFYFGPRSPMLYVIQHGYNGVRKEKPENIVYCVVRINDLVANNEELRKSSKVDPRKREYIKSHLLSALSNRPLALPIIDDVSDSGYKKQQIKNNYIRQIDKEVLKAGTYVNASALPDVIIDDLNELAYKAYNYLFLIHSSVRTVRIAYKDFKRVMDVIGVNEDFSILSLGVYLGNYEESYGKKEDVKFVNMESCFSYKNSKIYSILSAQQSVLVMKKSDIPFVRKEKVTDETKLKLINEEEYFYSNIDDINDLSENEVQFLKVNRGIYLYSKERFRYIRLTIDYNPGFVTEMNKVKEAREVTWP